MEEGISPSTLNNTIRYAYEPISMRLSITVTKTK